MRSFIRQHYSLCFVLGSILLTLILNHFLFGSLSNHEFVFIHDEYLPFSLHEAIEHSYFRIMGDFGIPNGVPLLVNFMENITYFAGYSRHLSTHTIQSFLYPTKLFLLICIPFFGFRPIAHRYCGHNSLIIATLASLYYSFNTFTLINWNGSFFFTYLLCYISAPLAWHYIHKVVFEKYTLTDLLITSLLIFIMSFTVYMFAVFILICAIFIVIHAALNKSIMHMLQHIGILTLATLPLMAVFLYVLADFISIAASAVSSSGGETYGNISGGVMYPFFMWFSWGLYNIWYPRNILTFFSYFRTIPSIVAPFLLYGVVVYPLIQHSKKITLDYCEVFLLFLINIIFIKSVQPPFGFVYHLLLKYIALFRIFRSPDMKFAFTYILLLCILLIIASKYVKKIFFVMIVAIVMCIQSALLLRGTILKGENTRHSSDRVVTFPSEYKELANLVNKGKDYGYVMTIPSQWFAIYNHDRKLYIAQDLLPKLINLPFVYYSESSAMPSQTYNLMTKMALSQNTDFFSTFPIRYFIIRRDIVKEDRNKTINSLEKIVKKNLPVIFENKQFTLYYNLLSPSIVSGKDISYTMISPVEYRVNLYHLSGTQEVTLNQNRNPGWQLYMEPVDDPCLKKESHCTETAPQQKIVNSRGLKKEYFNSWTLASQDIRKNYSDRYYAVKTDSSLHIKAKIVFTPHKMYEKTLWFSFGVASLYLLLIVGTTVISSVRSNRS